jgi:hypothetical protein
MLLLTLFVCIGCEWQFSSSDDDVQVTVERYDRIQSLYLTTGDFSALQQMNTIYPMQTRTLIEDVLRIGKVDDQQINTKFLRFYQDSTLQSIISEAEQQYANMDDINQELTTAFQYLLQCLPNIEIPVVYAQIGSLDQSVIVGNGQIGICLDKYLGADYALYQNENYGYTQEQKQMMQRQYIVPDCIGFYLLSLFPMPFDRQMSQEDRDVHMAKIQWVVNEAVGRTVFNNTFVNRVEKYMQNNKNVTPEKLLSDNQYQLFQ